MSNIDLNKYSDDDIKNNVHLRDSQIQAKSKLTKWTNEPKLEELKHDLTGAKSARSAYISNLDEWHRLYDAPKHGTDKHIGSRVTSKMIRKQAEWRSPALSEPFLSTSNLFEVKPLTFEDADRAKQNSLILNRQFNTQLNKVNLVDQTIRKLVKDGTVIARTGWKSKTVKVKEMKPVFEYYEATPEEVDQLSQQYEQLSMMRTSEPDSYEQLDESLKAGFEMSETEGVLYVAVESGVEEVEVDRSLYNKPTVSICDIKNVYIDPTCEGDINNAQFVIYSYESSLSDLKKDGSFKNLKYLSSLDSSGNPEHSSSSNTSGFKFADEARKKIVVFEYWGYREIDNSGETSSFTASWVGDTLIKMEDNPFPDQKPPFVVFNYLPDENSVYGVPDAELLGDNQEISSAVTRGMIDLMGKSANAQTGYSKNFLDISNQMKFRSGKDYMFNPGFDPRVHMHTHTFPEIPNSAMQMIQMQNNDAESMSGIKAFGQNGLSAVNFGNTATGVRGVLDAVSKRELSVLRRVSEGFKEIGRKIISMNSEFLEEKEVVRVTNSEFITVRRDDLAGDFDLVLTISTAEADDAKAQELAFMLQTMGDTMGQEVMRTILVEIATLRKMPDLAKKIENYEPEPDPIAEEMAQIALEQAKADVQRTLAEAAEISAKAAVYEAKVSVEQARAKLLDADTSNKALDFVNKDTGMAQQNELEKQRLINEGQIQTQDIKDRNKMKMNKDKHNMDMLSKLADSDLNGNNVSLGVDTEMNA